MSWSEIEKAFSRAVGLSFSKRKMALTFVVLVLCGILTVFCRTIARDAGSWISTSLLFLPMLLSSGILLGLGVILVRAHVHEVKQLSMGFRRLITGSLGLIVSTSYLVAAPLLIYLLLWLLLGFFFLLGEIPGLGEFFSVALSFGPFLLVFSFFLLTLFTLAVLFFGAPAVVFQGAKKGLSLKWWAQVFQGKILTSFVLFFLALLPGALLGLFLSFSASLSQVSLESSLSVAFHLFFIMLPFSAILTPAVIFFFNFATESYHLLQKK